MRVPREQGFFSLWRGNYSNVIRYFPTQAFNFAFKEKYKRLFNPYDRKTEPRKFFWGNVLSGGMAGASGLVFVYPLDFARTRLAADVGGKGVEREFNGLIDCIWKSTKRDGIFASYKGFSLGIFGAFAYRGAYFGLFDTFRANYPGAGIWSTWAMAQFTAMFSSFYIYPNDTIRRRMMMDVGRPINERKYKQK